MRHIVRRLKLIAGLHGDLVARGYDPEDAVRRMDAARGNRAVFSWADNARESVTGLLG